MNQAYPTVPTVQEVLDQRYESNGLYRWDVEGGTVWLPENVLRPALEAAYEEDFPEWQQFVELEPEQPNPSRLQRASDWDTWLEYIDPNATTTKAEFDAMTLEERLAIVDLID